MASKLEMTHGQIGETLSLAEAFFGSSGPSPQEAIVEPMIELAERLQGIRGYKGLLGVGYPFYATDAECGQVLPVPTVRTYLQQSREKVQGSAAVHGEAWPCAECQVVNQLPNLTDQCVPCDRVSFKPRDVFRALPDLDILVVFDETSADVEGMVQSVLTDMGWVRFNTDIKGAFENTVRVLEGDSTARLPVDFHILTLAQIKDAFQKIAADPPGPQVGILSRAWRAQWKDQPVDISYSFIFSMTEVGPMDPELAELLTETRRQMVTNQEVEAIISVLDRSRRCGPIVGELSLRRLLRKRIQGWQNAASPPRANP